jgi:GNAT superfamily N-acetyltransferase
MIDITENLQLKSVLSSGAKTLFTLMKEIYPLAYSHFWTDQGDWYVNTQYCEKNILKELLEENSEDYFILFKNEVIGNFRFIWDEKLTGLSKENQLKLHRIYLHPKFQGNGIGKTLLAWLDAKAIQKGSKIIWLDAIDAQSKTFQFYKKLGYNYHSHVFLTFDFLHAAARKMSQVYKIL